MPRPPCYAPVFSGGSFWSCVAKQLSGYFTLVVLTFRYIFSRSDSTWCAIQQIRFRLEHCRTGNTNPDLDLSIGTYEEHVHANKIDYGKSDAWEEWMLANRSRYVPVFDKARVKPRILTIAVRYDTVPIAYDPPWTGEDEHMTALEALAEASFPGYDFRFSFAGDPVTSYANVILGIPTNLSHAAGKDVFLYYEMIFNHEFGHAMNVRHHYDTDAEVGMGNHMPPGETGCTMDRNSNQYCSACRTALLIPLDVDSDLAIRTAMFEISRRYPY